MGLKAQDYSAAYAPTLRYLRSYYRNRRLSLLMRLSIAGNARGGIFFARFDGGVIIESRVTQDRKRALTDLTFKDRFIDPLVLLRHDTLRKTYFGGASALRTINLRK